MTHCPPPQPQEPLRVETLIDRDRLARLGRPAPLHLLAATLLEWLLVAISGAAAERIGSLWATAAAVVLIGSRQHALLILMHEFSHRQFDRRRPTVNDALGDVLTALPFFVTIHGFRRDHWAHHRHTGTERDPNWVSGREQARYRFPKSRAAVARLLVLHLCGVYTLRDLKGYLLTSRMAVAAPTGTRMRQAVFALSVLAVAWQFHGWRILAVYWLLPMGTVLIALLYLRDIAEHFALPRAGACFSRTTRVSTIEGWLLAPYHVGLHAEHHLFPAVPWCRLPHLHALLMRNPGHAQRAVVTHGVFSGVLAEASTAPDEPVQVRAAASRGVVHK